ncbi:histidine kinase [Flavobacteriaceae bacterium S0825]|uniref:tetratricopeptide repeat-containing sensor histidine kinase n=1 Tax=Gaetbulibacter sp. S0825 TaxID=2720084 RepID=UPI001AD83ABF|nr:tetratricopeptide repeat-containing sensor histidine kinase [Gaetbulibacter sp. S0825]MCK0107846.1 histidine kinase [Flavobacteriaceae bacterium S0825]
MKKNIFVLLSFFSVLFLTAQSIEQQVQLDSIIKLRKLSNNVELSSDERIRLASLAVEHSKKLSIDSTLLKSNWNLTGLYLNFDMNIPFGEINKSNLELAKKLKDTTYIALTYQNLGWYHLTQIKNDSAYYYYYNAVKIFDRIGDVRNKGETLFNMANIQETERDYIGSEKNAIEGLKLIRSLPTSERGLIYTYDLLNLLAVISVRLENYDQAIDYQTQALKVGEDIEDNLWYLTNSKNNIGYSLLQIGKYNEALKIFIEISQNKEFIELDPSLYVMAKGNEALAKIKLQPDNKKEVERIFLEAFKVTDSLDDPYGLLHIGNDIAEFYLDNNNTDLAEFYTKKTLNAAREINLTEEILRSLKILSFTEEGEKGKEYLYEHIKLNDSLLKNERAIRDKFARIEYETDQLEEDNEQLSRQTLILTIVTIALLFSIVFIYIIITQRARNRKLQFIQKQQEANEEIYNLMLAQQDKIEEGRTHEKKRISEELHDGILGKLFGTRLSLDSLNLVQTEEAAKNRSHYIDQLKTIETEIRKISHDLNSDFVSDSSFIDIIKALIETQTTAYNLEFEFSNDDTIDWEEMPNKTKIHIYRMLQETMQNIYKHANASLVKISFQLKNNVILCAIEDNGSGFNVNKARKGIGLKNIDSRVKEIEGKAEIFSKIDSGTTIKIFIPVK